jgi:hypothetical protein
VLEKLPPSKSDSETTKRIEAFNHLRSKPLGQEFGGTAMSPLRGRVDLPRSAQTSLDGHQELEAISAYS